MLTLPPSTRVFVATRPADMRRSFDGLMALVRDFLGDDPLSGHLFVFRNRGGDRLKILWWDRDGLAIFYKRLEEGGFTFPAAGEASRVEVTAAELQLILAGIDLSHAKRSKRYQKPATMGRWSRHDRGVSSIPGIPKILSDFRESFFALARQYSMTPAVATANPAAIVPDDAMTLPDDLATCQRMIRELLATLHAR